MTKLEWYHFAGATKAGARKFFVGVRPRYRKGRSMRRDLCDWFERSGVTVQGSALSPGVFPPSGIHLPSKRRCPKDLYKFACRILADILTNGTARRIACRICRRAFHERSRFAYPRCLISFWQDPEANYTKFEKLRKRTSHLSRVDLDIFALIGSKLTYMYIY